MGLLSPRGRYVLLCFLLLSCRCCCDGMSFPPFLPPPLSNSITFFSERFFSSPSLRTTSLQPKAATMHQGRISIPPSLVYVRGGLHQIVVKECEWKGQEKTNRPSPLSPKADFEGVLLSQAKLLPRQNNSKDPRIDDNTIA